MKMKLRVCEDGCAAALTASGVTRLSPEAARELRGLVERARTAGGWTPERLVGWLAVSPRAIEPVLSLGLLERGYVTDCRLCRAGADGRGRGRFSLLRRHGILATHAEIVAHRRHARRW